jgi:tetratricopeptide (TPR) repeat protein
MKNKMRFSLLVAGVVSLCNVAWSQTVDQGKKFLYYQRYRSAKEVFDKILASNPNNIDAIYWQGQNFLAMKDSVAAEDLYSKALQSNGNAPLLLVGMGNIELRKGKTTDARARFETAISLTKGKDINVLNAIGDANDDAKAGDANYAIEKLTQATLVKNFNSPETYLLMGDAYRKLIDGGNAVLAYQKALNIDPKLAEAKFKIGIIYLTQNNRDYFIPAFEDATKLDPMYAPAYYQLYLFYYYRDVNKAVDYLDKFIANMDSGPDLDYYKTDLLYVSSKFADAKAKAQGLISSLGDKADPRLYKLVAYCCDTLGDMACAKQYITTYFSKQDTANVVGADYAELANINSKATDSATMNEAVNDYKLAIAKDTLPDNRAKYIATATALAKKLGNKKGLADLALIYYNSKKNPVNTDLYNLGFANDQAGNYTVSDSIFCGVYESKFPNEIYGYLWCMRSKVAEDDSLGSQGLAVESYQKLAQMGRTLDSTAKAANSPDSNKYKAQIINSYSQLAGYYNNIKKDKPNAMVYLEKILEVDPGNPDATKFLEILRRPARQPAARPKATGTK